MFVINSDGKPIPLSYFAKWQPANAPLSVTTRAVGGVDHLL
jgi:multidrug efflux pump